MDAQPSPDTDLPAEKPLTAKRRATRKRQLAKQQQLRDMGYPVPKLSDAYRGRQLLNADTIREMHAAFREGGREAIDKVMKNQPAIFLKLLVLLVPRELQIEHRGGVKAMTEEQIIDAIEAIEKYLAQRRGDTAKVIEGTADVTPSVTPEPAP